MGKQTARDPIPFELRRNKLTVAVGHAYPQKGLIHPATLTVLSPDGTPAGTVNGQFSGISFSKPRTGRPKGSVHWKKHYARLLAREYFEASGMKPTHAADQAAEALNCSRAAVFSSLRTLKESEKPGGFLHVPGSESDPSLGCVLLVPKGKFDTTDSCRIAGHGFLWRLGMAEADWVWFDLTGAFDATPLRLIAEN